MKKTTYAIIALLVMIFAVETAFMFALSTTAEPYSQWFARTYGHDFYDTVSTESEIINDETIEPYDDESTDSEEPATVLYTGDQQVVISLNPEVKQTLNLSDGVLDTDTLIIISPSRNILIK